MKKVLSTNSQIYYLIFIHYRHPVSQTPLKCDISSKIVLSRLGIPKGCECSTIFPPLYNCLTLIIFPSVANNMTLGQQSITIQIFVKDFLKVSL